MNLIEDKTINTSESSTISNWILVDKNTITSNVDKPKNAIVDNIFSIIDKIGYDNTIKIAYTYSKYLETKSLPNPTSFERGKKMENNNLLEKYIEKVDRDQSDLRSDIRASEERTSKNLSEVQQRMDVRLNRIEDLLIKQNQSFEVKFDKLENKIDTKVNNLETKMDDNRKFMWGIVVTIIVSCVATAISVASMNNSLVQIVENLVSLVK